MQPGGTGIDEVTFGAPDTELFVADSFGEGSSLRLVLPWNLTLVSADPRDFSRAKQN